MQACGLGCEPSLAKSLFVLDELKSNIVAEIGGCFRGELPLPGKGKASPLTQQRLEACIEGSHHLDPELKLALVERLKSIVASTGESARWQKSFDECRFGCGDWSEKSAQGRCAPCGDDGQPTCSSPKTSCRLYRVSRGGICAPCGNKDEPACNDEEVRYCRGSRLAPSTTDGFCRPCGSAGRVPCADDACGAGLASTGDKCVPCGGQGERICVGETLTGCSEAGLVAVSGRNGEGQFCTSCGDEGQPACFGGSCNAGLILQGRACTKTGRTPPRVPRENAGCVTGKVRIAGSCESCVLDRQNVSYTKTGVTDCERSDVQRRLARECESRAAKVTGGVARLTSTDIGSVQRKKSWDGKRSCRRKGSAVCEIVRAECAR